MSHKIKITGTVSFLIQTNVQKIIWSSNKVPVFFIEAYY